MAKIPSPMPIFTTLTKAERVWLYQLWQAIGGDTESSEDDQLLAGPQREATANDDSELLAIGMSATSLARPDDYLTPPHEAVQADVLPPLPDRIDEIDRKLDDVLLMTGAP